MLSKPGETILPTGAIVMLSDETVVDGLPELRWELRNLILDGARHIVVDLSRVERLSSNALATLLSAHRACRARGGGLVIRRPNRRSLDLLHHTGLHRVFVVEDAS